MNQLTQQQKILKLLEESPDGINSYDLTYRYSIKQAPTRIKELKEQGYLITASRNKNMSVTYHLVGVSKSEASKPIVEPQKETPVWEKPLVRVEKNGRVFWEEPKEGEQLSL